MKRLIIYAWATLLCCAAYAQVPNVTGRVTSTGGLPIEGVVVSDGFNCTQTDADGRYALTSDLELRRFVFVSVPAEYEIPARHGCPQFFRRIDRFQKEVKADFVLEPRLVPAVHHTLLVQGDPQIKNYGVDGSAEAYRSVVIPDMIRMRSTITTPCYGINLGDLVYNDMNVYNAYIDNTGRVNTTTFNVIGNHDHDQTTILSDSLGTVYFEMYLGPTCYSANIGDMHYVFVDNILYGRDDATKSYELGLSDEIAHWLRQDLSYVPKDKTIMICAHSQMFKKHSSFSTRNKNYPVYRDELLKFKNVYSWAGTDEDRQPNGRYRHAFDWFAASEQAPQQRRHAPGLHDCRCRRRRCVVVLPLLRQGPQPPDAPLFARADRKRLRAGQRLDLGRCLGTCRMVGRRRQGGRNGAMRGVRPRLRGPLCHGDQQDHPEILSAGQVVPHVPDQAGTGRKGGRGPCDRSFRDDLCGTRKLVRYDFGYCRRKPLRTRPLAGGPAGRNL